VVWEAEFYLEIRWSTQAIIEYLNYFAQQRQPLPVSLYFGVIELIETSGESERWQRSLRDALGPNAATTHRRSVVAVRLSASRA